MNWTRAYDRDVPLFFPTLPLNLGAYDLSQKTIGKKLKLLYRG